jgi:hypothetical protein
MVWTMEARFTPESTQKSYQKVSCGAKKELVDKLNMNQSQTQFILIAVILPQVDLTKK